MNPWGRRQLLQVALSFALLWLSWATIVPPANASGTEITGDYRYAFHRPETGIEAKAHACREAAKAAVSRSPIFREATASLVDSTLLRDVLDLVVREALTELQTVEQTEKGTTASCTVKGRLDARDVSSLLAGRIQGAPDTQPSGSDQNMALRLVRVSEDESGQLLVTYQALRRLDWLSTAYQGSLREQADIVVEFYDGQGQLLSHSRYHARTTPTGDDVMIPGQVGSRTISKPAGATSYRVWLPPAPPPP